MFDHGNIFKTAIAHEHQSVLYPNRMAVSNKGLKPAVLQRGLLILYLDQEQGASSPQSLLKYKSWSSQDNVTYVPGEDDGSRQLQCKSLKGSASP